MTLILKKDGGTSVADIERIGNAARRPTKWRRQAHLPVVIISARSGESNRLIGRAEEIQAGPEVVVGSVFEIAAAARAQAAAYNTGLPG